MPLNVTVDSKEKLGTFIRLETIKKMVQNFVELTGKRKSLIDQFKPLSSTMDSHSVHFSKQEIDELFVANFPPDADPTKYGVRIYLGMHGLSAEERSDMPNRPSRFIDQHTVIIVCTHNQTDLLEPGKNSVSHIYPLGYGEPEIDGEGKGLEEGQICPPPAPPCRGKLIFPQPENQ